MRKPLRYAIAVLHAAGLRVEGIEHGRHTEIFVEGGHIIRLHRGGRVSPTFERSLRSAVRRIGKW
jgi:hypothetical protein